MKSFPLELFESEQFVISYYTPIFSIVKGYSKILGIYGVLLKLEKTFP